jgi:hypothetical protein
MKVSDEMTKVAELYSGAISPVVLSSPTFFEASSNIALIKGEALSVPVDANAKGTVMLGLGQKSSMRLVRYR